MNGKRRIRLNIARCVKGRCAQYSRRTTWLTTITEQEKLEAYFAGIATALRGEYDLSAFEPGSILMRSHSCGTYAYIGNEAKYHTQIYSTPEPRSWLVRLFHRLKQSVGGKSDE